MHAWAVKGFGFLRGIAPSVGWVGVGPAGCRVDWDVEND
jgi:hypothetical protein